MPARFRLLRSPRTGVRIPGPWLLAFALLVLAPAPPAPATEPPPGRVQELLRLLAEPEVQRWLEAQRTPAPAPPASATYPAEAADASLEHQVDSALSGMRARIGGIVRAVSALPAELAPLTAALAGELLQGGMVRILLLLAVFVGLGLGAEAVVRRIAAPSRARLLARPIATPADRLAAAGLRLLSGLLRVGAFAVGSAGAFLVLSWPPVLYSVLLGYLVAFVLLRLTIVTADFLLEPDAAQLRIVPMADGAARYWARWLVLLVGWYLFGRATIAALASLGAGPDFRALVTSALALVWLGLALAAVWRRPARHADGPAPSRTLSWAVSAYLALLWHFVLAGLPTLFWLGLAVVLVPFLLRLVDQSVALLLRPGEGADDGALPGLAAVALHRGLRALVILAAAGFLARTLGIDAATIAAGDTVATRLLAGALKAVVILLVADLVWHLARAWIDQRLGEARAEADPGSEEARRRARIRTLLPIVRSFLMVTVAAIAIMMALSALGVEIGPLIAGAGVVGVAVGFGSQTLVRDIISGAFYLMDDAFRVGEYIQAGSFKGTVESFSLRSIKLRHHRGPLFTVPFGQLGAIQNMSRDWVIDKITVSVTYDSDLDKIKKIIKQIGKDLQEIEEFKPHIIETLKMQGVDQFGDFAIQIRMKMKTKPGEQFTIRRRAYAMIKKAFDANGIKFAFPTVTVAGGGESATAAIAKQGLELARPQPEAA